MHIKLDSDGKILFGKFLVKTSADLVKMPELIGHQIEGYGVTLSNICCYDDTEATVVMAMMQDKGIDAELVALDWDQELIDNVGTEPYKQVEDVYSKLLILKTTDVVESGIDIPMTIISPPELMGSPVRCNFICKEEVTGTSYSTVHDVEITGTITYFNHLFITSGQYTIETSSNHCIIRNSIAVGPANVLTGIKSKKIKELDGLCNAAIQAGFKSWCLGSEHTYDFDYEAQINFSGVLNGVSAGLMSGPIIWKTKESGPLPHTIDQFKTLFTDGMLFKQLYIGKYWQMKQTVMACKTIEEVQAINW